MCAISGLLGQEAEQDQLRQMLSAMNPHGKRARCFQRADAALLYAGDQGISPPEQTVDGRKFVTVFAGRIENQAKLRRELERDGAVLEGNEPEQLLTAAYSRYGSTLPERLEGPFAFAIWEGQRRELFFARDQMGIEPFFYLERPGCFLFASDLKTVAASPGFQPQLDREGAAQLLLIGPGRSPDSGIFRGVAQLEPGCRGLWKEGRLSIHRYWKLQDGPHPLDFEETAQAVRQRLCHLIRRQTDPGAQIGAFLSGGLDSGIVCAVMAEMLSEQSQRLSSFSVDYQNNDRYFVPGKFQPSADSDYMGILEEALHTDAHRIILTPQQLDESLEEAVLARDLPGMGDVDSSLLLLCRQMRPHIRIALSGECSDELFGGYPWYRDPEIRNREGFPWAQSTARRTALLQPGILTQEEAEAYLAEQYRETVEQSDILPDTAPLERRMKEMMNLNVRWFLQTLLERNCRMSRAADLEVRVPFCDWQLAQLLYRVPWEMKEHRGMEKGLLRHAMGPWLPEAIRTRKKSPYPKTHDPEYLKRMQKRMERLLEDRSAPLWEMVRPEAVEELSVSRSDWPFYGQLMRTPQTLCYLLQMDFWLRHYRVNLCLRR